MDYLKTVVPSQLVTEQGSNLVVINPGSANVRIGLAHQDTPFNIPHCISRYTNQFPKLNVKDQTLNSQVTTAKHMDREKAHVIIASLLKIPFLDEEVVKQTILFHMGHVDRYAAKSGRKDIAFTWANVYEPETHSSLASERPTNDSQIGESLEKHEHTDAKEPSKSERKYRGFICGEEGLRISPTEPYCLHCPIRRGHLNISQHYPMQQVLEDLHAIWVWILVEKLHIPHSERSLYAAILVLSETFDNREGLAAVFGNGLSTACVVNVGAQDGVALPNTEKTLPFGGEDISRCLLWTQRHHQTWPQIPTDIVTKPIDLLMLNRVREFYCEIKEGEVDAVAVIHSYEGVAPSGSHKTRLTALNVLPIGLFYSVLLVPDVYPPPPRSCYLVFPSKPKKEEKVGVAEAITSSILSTEFYMKSPPMKQLIQLRFCSQEQIKPLCPGKVELSLEFLISVGMLGYRGRIGFAMGFTLGVAENIMILTIFKPSNVLYKFLKERNECSDLELATVGESALALTFYLMKHKCVAFSPLRLKRLAYLHLR